MLMILWGLLALAILILNAVVLLRAFGRSD